MVVAKTPANENAYNRTVEDKFIDNILSNVKSLQSRGGSPNRASTASLSFRAPNGSTHNIEVSRDKSPSSSKQLVHMDPSASLNNVTFTSSDPAAWEDYAKSLSEARK